MNSASFSWGGDMVVSQNKSKFPGGRTHEAPGSVPRGVCGSARRPRPTRGSTEQAGRGRINGTSRTRLGGCVTEPRHGAKVNFTVSRALALWFPRRYQPGKPFPTNEE